MVIYWAAASLAVDWFSVGRASGSCEGSATVDKMATSQLVHRQNEQVDNCDEVDWWAAHWCIQWQFCRLIAHFHHWAASLAID